MKCSLAPVCLPEEARLADRLTGEQASVSVPETLQLVEMRSDDEVVIEKSGIETTESLAGRDVGVPLRLFPAEDELKFFVLTNGAKVSKRPIPDMVAGDG